MNEQSILLIDADGDSKAIVSEAATLAGRDVLVARTSRDAFRILGDQIQRLDLVIVDVDPGAHGLALLEAISSCADRPPIIVITALEETYMEPIALKHGAAACLGKPITVRRLGSLFNHASKRSLTCDRWGCLIPSTAHEELNLNGCFRGIAVKLSHPFPATVDPSVAVDARLQTTRETASSTLLFPKPTAVAWSAAMMLLASLRVKRWEE